MTTLIKTEGEKDADRLKTLLPKTHAAFTNYEGGATNKWYPEYDELVAGKHVIVCEDNDEVGRAHAAFWAESCLLAGALSVKVDSYVDELPEKGDVSDYLDANPKANLLRRWSVLPTWTSPEQQRFLTIPEFLARLPEKVEWLWAGRIPRGSAVLFTGQNKIGKSTFVNYLIRARSAGKPFLGQATTRGRTLLLTEMSDADLKSECEDCPRLGTDPNVSVLTQNDCYDWTWEETLRQALLRCKTVGIDLLVVDTFNSWTLLENQNDAGQTLRAYHSMRQFLQEGIAVFIQDHEGIEQRDIHTARRGSTTLTGQVSMVLSLRHLSGNHGPDTKLRNLVRSGRHGVSSETIEWKGNDYVLLGTSAAVASEAASKQIADLLPRDPKKAMSLAELCKATGSPANNGTASVGPEDCHERSPEAAGETQQKGRRTQSLEVLGETMKIDRNAPCPCGSGLKYKKCCATKQAALRELCRFVALENPRLTPGECVRHAQTVSSGPAALCLR